jgi:hypothetical protein
LTYHVQLKPFCVGCVENDEWHKMFLSAPLKWLKKRQGEATSEENVHTMTARSLIDWPSPQV